MKLNELKPAEGSNKKYKRLGRGIGSGKGKTSAKGGKGQTARSGTAIRNFEGGQTPLYQRLPKRGFNNISRVEYSVINIGDLQKHIESGKLKQGEKVTSELLLQKGIVKKARAGIKLLAKGKLDKPLNIEVALASAAAIEAVKKAGGSVVVTVVAAPETPKAN